MLDIYFKEGFPVKPVNAASLSQREVVYGHGINDAPYVINPQIKGVRYQCPFYKVWQNMLKRVYDNSYKNKNTTYLGTSVCKTWLKFMNFRYWMQDQDWEGKQLDKDVLVRGNKLYSPGTCLFVSSNVNLFILESDARRGELPIGVSFCKTKNKYTSFCSSNVSGLKRNLGSFDDPTVAHNIWWETKKDRAIELANKQTDKRVETALLKRYTGNSPYLDKVL